MKLSTNIMHDQMMCRDNKPKLDLHFYYGTMPLCNFQIDNPVGYIPLKQYQGF